MHGRDAEPTAAHHAIHLEAYANKFGIALHHIGVEKINDTFSAAVLVLDCADVHIVQNALRPHHVIEYTE